MSFEFSSKILAYDAFQIDDEIDKDMERDFTSLIEFIEQKSENEIITELQSQVSDVNIRKYKQVMNGLLYAILTRPDLASTYYHFLVVSMRDNYVLVIEKLAHFSSSLFHKMQELPRKQLLWLVDQLVEKKVSSIENVVLHLLRNVHVGNQLASASLCEFLMYLFQRHEAWVLTYHGLISTSTYVFLRTIPTHYSNIRLCPLLVAWSLKMLNEKPTECSLIGRDLVRALNEASIIPEISEFYEKLKDGKDVEMKLKMTNLLTTPTPKHFLQSRMYFDMELNLAFLLEEVPWGKNDDIYFLWLQQLYFSTPQSSFVFAEFLRFIVSGYVQNRNQRNQNPIPKFAALGKLLLQIPQGKDASRRIQASLLFDWIGYTSAKDTIQAVEATIILILQSAEKFTRVSQFLIDGLAYLINDYIPEKSDLFLSHAKKAVRDLRLRGVVKSWAPLKKLQLTSMHRAFVDSLFLTDVKVSEAKIAVTPWIKWKRRKFDFSSSIDEKFVNTLEKMLSIYELTPGLDAKTLAGQLGPILIDKLKANDLITDYTLTPIFKFLNKGDRFLKLLKSLEKPLQFDEIKLTTRLLVYAINNDDFSAYEKYKTVTENGSKSEMIDSNVQQLFELYPKFFFENFGAILESVDGLVGNLDFIRDHILTVEPASQYYFAASHSLGMFSLFVQPGGTLKIDAETLISTTIEWDSFEQKAFWDIYAVECQFYPELLTIFKTDSIRSELEKPENGELALGIFEICRRNTFIRESFDVMTFITELYEKRPDLSIDYFKCFMMSTKSAMAAFEKFLVLFINHLKTIQRQDCVDSMFHIFVAVGDMSDIPLFGKGGHFVSTSTYEAFKNAFVKFKDDDEKINIVFDGERKN